MNRFLLFCFSAVGCFGQIQSGPPLPYHVVEGWPQLPTGWNFGEVAAVDVDKADNVWVFSDGPHPVMEFSSTGNCAHGRNSWGRSRTACAWGRTEISGPWIWKPTA